VIGGERRGEAERVRACAAAGSRERKGRAGAPRRAGFVAGWQRASDGGRGTGDGGVQKGKGKMENGEWRIQDRAWDGGG
jgi:hypothetical protein